MEKKNKTDLGRREFLRRIGIGAGSAVALMALDPLNVIAQEKKTGKTADNRMTYRVQHGSGEQISLLGFGMMRLPNSQEEVNRLVDYAMEHGVNYYDTAPIYMQGQSEVLTGNALARYPRDKYFVATKMSNMWGESDVESAKEMYRTSLKKLRVDYIDCYMASAMVAWTPSTIVSSRTACSTSCWPSARPAASVTSDSPITAMSECSTGC